MSGSFHNINLSEDGPVREISHPTGIAGTEYTTVHVESAAPMLETIQSIVTMMLDLLSKCALCKSPYFWVFYMLLPKFL